MDIFINTPWWVYLLFIFIVALGFRSTRPNTLPFYRLILLPGIFTIWNIIWLAERLEGRFALFIFWLIGLAVGAFLGWQIVLSWKVRVDHKNKRISLPGTWSTLIFIAIVFASRYFFVYNYEMHPEIASHLFTPDALISGTITGVFIGQVLELYRKYKVQNENH